MHKKFCLFFVFIIVFFVHSFADPIDTLTYKICYNENYVPYVYRDTVTGELDGVLIKWWKLWAKKAEVGIEFVPERDLKSCIDATIKGKVDAIAGLFYSEERAKKLDFSDPIIRMQTVLFLKNRIKVDSLSQITDTIGVIKHDLAISYMQEHYPHLKLKIVDSYKDLRNLVIKKEISGFVYDLPYLYENYDEINLPKAYHIQETLYSQHVMIAVKAGNKKLLDLIHDGASKIAGEELYKEVGIQAMSTSRRVYIYVFWAAGILIVMGFIIFYVKIFRKNAGNALAENKTEKDWKKIIDNGENDKVEFKSSLRWDYYQSKPNKALEKVIAKTISAFLNSRGGVLLIGVDDEGNILGLENDFNCMNKGNRDGFLLNLTNIINANLGKDYHNFINASILTISEKDVCVVSIKASDTPVFMGSKENEEFYIRASASSQPLGLRETHNYINSRWKRKNI